MIECWLNGEHKDTMVQAAQEIGISPSILCKARDEGRIIIDHEGRRYEVTFYPPPATPKKTVLPPRERGAPLLARLCVHRLGVYHGERI